jgi:ubiquinone/menaquinone biosynthesis C-methylase UbiE
MMSLEERLARSRALYDLLHAEGGFVVDDGTYEAVASLTRGLRTVDVGCGEGWLEMLNPDVVGVDFSAVALERARENGALNLVQASAEALPFDDASFDLAVSLGCLEHFADSRAALRELARVSRLQLLTVHEHLPVIGHLRKPLLSLRGHHDQPIERPFSRRRLRNEFAAAGLVPIFIGSWRYIDLRYLWSRLPYGVVRLPSHIFVLSYTRASSTASLPVTR